MNYGRAGCTGLTYDGHRLSDVFQVADVQIPLLPTISAVSRSLAQRTGEYFASRKVGTREIKIKLRLDAGSRSPEDIYAALRHAAAMFNVPDPRPLSFGDGLYTNAILVGDTAIEDVATYGEVELTMLCHDPFFYGDEHAITLAGETSFAVTGDECWPVIECTATGAAVVATNAVTGEYVRVPCASGNRVVIDMGRQRAERNGEFAPVDLMSDWWSVSGDARVSVSGATATLRYRERWL